MLNKVQPQPSPRRSAPRAQSGATPAARQTEARLTGEAARKIVVFGFLDPFWDQDVDHPGTGHWRPTVAAVSSPALPVHRFELLVQPESAALADEVSIAMRAACPGIDIRRHTHPYRDVWDFEEVYAYLHDVVADYPFDLEKEDYYVHMSTGTHVMRICVFLLAETHFLPARILQTYPGNTYGGGGGKNCAATPAGMRVIELDLARYDQLAKRFAARRNKGAAFLKSGIATRNEGFNRLIDEIEAVAIASSDPILLMGPTGAGKSMLAERIAELKRQRFQHAGSFVPVNCATLRGDGAMSALFGHRKGAFTGATSNRQGLLGRANGGVLFLDEIGELGAEEQAMLLRTVETGRYYPVGSDLEEESRFQLIAGTNRDLRAEAARGRFRDDLLARINLWTYRLPGLAARREDIEPNLDYELQSFARRCMRQASFNREARQRYLAFASSAQAVWSGNFRDLAGSVNRMATLAPGGRITRQTVEREIERLLSDWNSGGSADDDELLTVLNESQLRDVDLFDRAQLREVVRVCRTSASLSEAGRVLFQASRAKRASTNDSDRLRKYLASFGLAWDQVARRNGLREENLTG